MSNNHQSPHGLDQPHRAGDCTTFAGGRVNYLAPMPLPTGQHSVFSLFTKARGTDELMVPKRKGKKGKKRKSANAVK